MTAYSYEYPRPAVTVDALVLTWGEEGLEVLLIERGHDPFAGHWALPGGFVDQDEALDQAMRRELLEEAGLEVGPILQIGAYGDPGRDPRGHTIGVAFLAAMPRTTLTERISAGDDARQVALFPLKNLPALAFDHGRMLADLGQRLETDRRARELLRTGLGWN
ncbi:MAG: NUDIX hydrolase [Planctomycetes bacterium]|nr:NUDIX hydrolase [Planctomycetota bacterium]